VDWGGALGQRIFLVLFFIFFTVLLNQNFDVYFHKQATNPDCWGEYIVITPDLGQGIHDEGSQYDSFIFRSDADDCIRFYDYANLSHLHSFKIPDSLVPLSIPANRGILFALDRRMGILRTLQLIYPNSVQTSKKDITGHPFACFLDVPPALWAQSKGVRAQVAGKPATLLNDFPKTLPKGPNRIIFSGSLFLAESGRYRLINHGKGIFQWQAQGRPVLGAVNLIKGYIPIRLIWNEPPGEPSLNLELVSDTGLHIPLDADHLTPLKVPQGLLAKYFDTEDWKGSPALEQWEPVINYGSGRDFYVNGKSASWEGRLKVVKGGTYQFEVQKDKDAQGWLVIDGKDVILLGEDQSDPVKLLAGSHSFKFYYQAPAFESVNLRWKEPGVGWEIIPSDAFL
jgi:hypothetical protein